MLETKAEMKLNGRSARGSESRLHDGRVSFEEGRAPIVFGEGSAFNVPEAIRLSDPEHSYSYIAYTSGGKDLRSEYDDAVYRRGFQPVKRSSHPLLGRSLVDSPFGRQDDDDLQKVGGQILMKRPIEVAKAEEEYYSERVARQNYIRNMHANANPGTPRIMDDNRMFGGIPI